MKPLNPRWFDLDVMVWVRVLDVFLLVLDLVAHMESTMVTAAAESDATAEAAAES